MANELGHNKNNEKNYSKMFFPQKAMLKERNLSRSFFKFFKLLKKNTLEF